MPPFSILSLSEVDHSIRSHVGRAAVLATPSTTEKFRVETSSIAAFFGGDTAFSAMRTIHIYRGSRWQRWYNQPGSFGVAKRYGQLARSAFWDTIFPGLDVEPSSLFPFHTDEHVPNYFAIQETSGPYFEATGYVARCFFNKCKAWPVTDSHFEPHSAGTTGCAVTILKLNGELEDGGLSSATVTLPQTTSMKLMAAIPILASLSTAAMCAILDDWYCCSMILFGMACNGIACCVVGRAALTGTHQPPRSEENQGTRYYTMPSILSRTHIQGPVGVLYDGNDLIVVQSPKHKLDAIAHGKLTLGTHENNTHYHDIGACAILLSLQLLGQLLVVPQGSLFGQLLFLVSLVFSWVYNSCIASPDTTQLFHTIIFGQVLGIPSEDIPGFLNPGPRLPEGMEKYEFQTRPTAVVFALLEIAPHTDGAILRVVLDRLLKDNTPVWTRWKRCVVKCIERQYESLPVNSARLKSDFEFDFSGPGLPEDPPLSFEETIMMENLSLHAHTAVWRYHNTCPAAKGPAVPVQQGDNDPDAITGQQQQAPVQAPGHEVQEDGEGSLSEKEQEEVQMPEQQQEQDEEME
ncbi:hypothetical protein VTO73DRAFT_8000 [Trametes versicolor]